MGHRHLPGINRHQINLSLSAPNASWDVSRCLTEMEVIGSWDTGEGAGRFMPQIYYRGSHREVKTCIALGPIDGGT